MPSSKRHKGLLAACAVLLGLVVVEVPLGAQESPVLNRRVRVSTPQAAGGEPRFVGTATALRMDTLIVSGSDTVRAFPLSTIVSLDVSRGRRGHAFVGALVGAGIGVLAGAAAAGEDDGQGSTGTGVILVPLGAAIYGGLGALIGSLIRRERWEPIPVESVRCAGC